MAQDREQHDPMDLASENKQLREMLEQYREEVGWWKHEVEHKETELEHTKRQLRVDRRALTEARNRILAMHTIAEVGTWVWNVDQNTVDADRKMAQIYGIRDEDIPDAPLNIYFRRIHLEDRERIQGSILKTVEQGMDFHDEYRIECNGSTKWIAAHGRFIGDCNDKGKRIMIGTVIDISSLRVSDAYRFGGEGRFRGTFENTAVGIAFADMTGTFVRVNQRFCEITGYECEELIDKTIGDLTYSEDLSEDMRLTEQLIGGEIPSYHLDKRYVRKNGSLIWVALTKSLQRNADGTPVYTMAVIQDISVRKQMEASLVESVQQFQRAVFAAPFPIMLHIDAGDVLIVNDSWVEQSGYMHSMIPTVDTWVDKAFGSENSTAKADMERLYSIEDKIHEGAKVIRTSTGEQRVWDFSSAPLGKDSHGNRMVITMAIDITERTRVEQALRDSRNRYHQLSDSMPQLVWTAQPDGTIDYYNYRYKEFDGISIKKDNHWEWIPVVHPDDKVSTCKAWNRAVATGTDYQIEHRVRRADGSYHWYLSWAVPARDENGTIMKWYGTATDIDDVKKVQHALQHSETRLKALTEMLEFRVARRTAKIRSLAKALTLAEQRERQYLSQLLHENLQQILFSAKMRIDILERDLRSPIPEIKEDIVEIKRLTRKALDTSRTLALELNPPILKEEGFDAALRWLAHHMNMQHGLDVSVSIEEPFRSIPEEERILLIQLVRELLLNIVKHAAVKKAVVTAKRQDKELVVNVEDRGVGFDVKKVWKNQTYSEHFGLVRIKERLKLFNGKLHVESKPGRGTVTKIHVPL